MILVMVCKLSLKGLRNANRGLRMLRSLIFLPMTLYLFKDVLLLLKMGLKVSSSLELCRRQESR